MFLHFTKIFYLTSKCPRNVTCPARESQMLSEINVFYYFTLNETFRNDFREYQSATDVGQFCQIEIWKNQLGLVTP